MEDTFQTFTVLENSELKQLYAAGISIGLNDTFLPIKPLVIHTVQE